MVALVSIPTASTAVCSEPKSNQEQLAFSRNIVATSDVIVDATLVAKYDFNRRQPETFVVHKVLKGPPMRELALWLPGRNDLLSTVGAPTSGKAVGSRMLLALTKKDSSFVIGECNARTIFDPSIRTTVETLTSLKQEDPGDGR